MARELEVTVVVADTGAKAALEQIDASFDKSAASAQKYAVAVAEAEVATKTASTSIGTVSVSAKEATETLEALGIKTGGLRTSLNDLATATGLNVESLGLMGSAGLALGVAYASWNIGRMIADFFDLDKKIANATASLLGYGNVAAETAGAKQDAVNLAIQRGATALADITDKQDAYTKAIEFNAQWVKNQNEGYKFLINSEQAWQAELDKHAASLPGLKRDLDLHVLKINELAEKYGITQHAIELYRHELKETEDQEKRTAAIRKQVNEETDRAWATQQKWIADINKQTAELVDSQEKRRLDVAKAITSEFEKQVAALAKQANSEVLSELDAKKANQAAQGFDLKGNRIDDAVGQAAATLAATMAELNQQRARGVETSAREEQAMNAYIAVVTKANGTTDQMAGAHAQAAGAAQQLAAGAASAASALGNFQAGVGYQVPTGESLDKAGIIQHGSSSGFAPLGSAPLPWGGARRASGGPVSSGSPYLVGELGPEIFTPGASGSITPNGGVTIGDVHVHGNVDSQATAERMAQRTAEIVYQKLRGQGKMTLGRA